MMHSKSGTRLLAACLAAIALVAGCDHVKDQLLQPQNPGIVDPGAVSNATLAGALALRVGALGRYTQVENGEVLWEYAGVLTDEFSNSDFNTASTSMYDSSIPSCHGATPA